jgi:hypothetical protein
MKALRKRCGGRGRDGDGRRGRVKLVPSFGESKLKRRFSFYVIVYIYEMP